MSQCYIPAISRLLEKIHSQIEREEVAVTPLRIVLEGCHPAIVGMLCGRERDVRVAPRNVEFVNSLALVTWGWMAYADEVVSRRTCFSFVNAIRIQTVR